MIVPAVARQIAYQHVNNNVRVHVALDVRGIVNNFAVETAWARVKRPAHLNVKALVLLAVKALATEVAKGHVRELAIAVAAVDVKELVKAHVDMDVLAHIRSTLEYLHHNSLL